MNWQEALEEIQSVEFDVNLNVVSGTNAFFQAVAQEPAVLEECRELRQSGEVREDALGRIHELVKQETDPRFENPNDTPLAVLLWLTAFAAPDCTKRAAAQVDLAPRCWYAKKLAQRILNPPPSTTGDSRFGELPASSVTIGVTSGETRFRLRQNMEGPFQSAVSSPIVASSTPVTNWELESQFATTFQEGTP